MKRVLVRIPAGNGMVSDRYFAVDMREAKEILSLGSQDKNSWFAGAKLIEDPKEYPRYGYKECDLNGVIRDDSINHLSRVEYEEYYNSRNRVTEVTADTEGGVMAAFEAMRQEIADLKAQVSESPAKKRADTYARNKKKKADLEAVRKS